MKCFLLTALTLLAASYIASQNALAAGPSGATPVSEAVEFRGVYSAPNDILVFSLHFKHSGQSAWVKPQQERYGLRIVEYDEDAYALTVTYGSTNQILHLKEANETPVRVTYSRKSKSGNHANAKPESSEYAGNDEYHDQAPNPAAAKLVLEAVKRRQKMASVTGTSYTSLGTKTENHEQAISSDLTDEKKVTRNRVYNKDYAL